MLRAANPADAYQILDIIGSGASSTVYRAINRLTGSLVAVKQMVSNDAVELALLQKEVTLLEKLEHPLVTRVLEAFLYDNSMSIVLQSYDTSLREVISEAGHGGLHPDAITEVIVLLLRALSFLHERGIVHRDLKPGNILIDQDGSVVLADLGVAAAAADYRTQHATLVGTPLYCAPETIRGENKLTRKPADVWSVGIILIECLDGLAPRSEEHPLRALFNIAAATFPPSPTSPQAAAVNQLVATILVIDADKRPTASSLLQSSDLLIAAARRIDDLGGGTRAPSIGPLLDDVLDRVHERRAMTQPAGPVAAPPVTAAFLSAAAATPTVISTRAAVHEPRAWSGTLSFDISELKSLTWCEETSLERESGAHIDLPLSGATTLHDYTQCATVNELDALHMSNAAAYAEARRALLRRR